MTRETTEMRFQLPDEYALPSVEQSHPLYDYRQVLDELLATIYRVELAWGKITKEELNSPSFTKTYAREKELMDSLKKFPVKLYIAEQGSSSREQLLKSPYMVRMRMIFSPSSKSPHTVTRPNVPEYSSRLRKALQPLADNKNRQPSYRNSFEMVKQIALEARQSLLNALNQSSDS